MHRYALLLSQIYNVSCVLNYYLSSLLTHMLHHFITFTCLGACKPRQSSTDGVKVTAHIRAT